MPPCVMYLTKFLSISFIPRYPDVYLLGALHATSVLLREVGLWRGPLQALPILAGEDSVDTEHFFLQLRPVTQWVNIGRRGRFRNLTSHLQGSKKHFWIYAHHFLFPCIASIPVAPKLVFPCRSKTGTGSAIQYSPYSLVITIALVT